ncbi:UNVERIFIED_CONTAM: hypothetical protein NCL1_51293 [Trichonephila clavipes]
MGAQPGGDPSRCAGRPATGRSRLRRHLRCQPAGRARQQRAAAERSDQPAPVRHRQCAVRPVRCALVPALSGGAVSLPSLARLAGAGRCRAVAGAELGQPVADPCAPGRGRATGDPLDPGGQCPSAQRRSHRSHGHADAPASALAGRARALSAVAESRQRAGFGLCRSLEGRAPGPAIADARPGRVARRGWADHAGDDDRRVHPQRPRARSAGSADRRLEAVERCAAGLPAPA